jgi:hypothetical protein
MGNGFKLIMASKGTELMSHFNRTLNEAGFGDTLRHGIMMRSRHEIRFGEVRDTPAYAARYTAPFIRGYMIISRLISHSFEVCSTDEFPVNFNYTLPNPIHQKMLAIIGSKPTEFTLKIALTEREYGVLTVFGLNQLKESTFFESGVPCLGLAPLQPNPE